MGKRWAALAADGQILVYGVTHGRFERQCLDHSCQTFNRWHQEGARYCEIFATIHKTHLRVYIQDIPHGRIRRCTSTFQL